MEYELGQIILPIHAFSTKTRVKLQALEDRLIVDTVQQIDILLHFFILENKNSQPASAFTYICPKLEQVN